MSYLALRFDLAGAQADRWTDALLEAGALSAEVTDPRAGTPQETAVYAEPGERSAQWPDARITALFAEGVDAMEALQRIARALGEAAPPARVSVVAEQDWVRATQDQFGPICIAPGFWIVPSWCRPPEPNALNLSLDPGIAFGTGSHPTTRMCLEWLRERVTPQTSVLDYGCGSGILAIAAAKLGAGNVAGTDIDPQAVEASRLNALRNRVHPVFCRVDDLPAASFDLVVANILANPLIALAPVLAQLVRDGGHLALAGLLEPQVDEVAAAYSPWFNIAPVRCAEGWTLMQGERSRMR